MFKTIIKEIAIMLLLCIAIVLVLGMVFYKSNPLSKMVPETVAYEIPNEIKDELKQEDNEEEILVTYRIDEEDLEVYQTNKSYNPGKANPFASPSSGNNTSNNTNTTDKGNTTNTNKPGSNSTGELFENGTNK